MAAADRQRIAPGRRATGADARSQSGLHPAESSVEALIDAAINRDDYAPFEELLAVLAKPYEDQPAMAAYADPPEPHQRVLQTFCGT